MISDYAGNALLNSLFGKSSSFGALGSVPTIYLALLTVYPTPDKTGATITEANYTGYTRIATAASDWAAASGRAILNSAQKNFPTCTASSSTVNSLALLDSVTIGAGNLLAAGELMLPQTIGAAAMTRSANIATVALTAHGYSVGDTVLITNIEQPEYNGWKVIATVPDANTFTFAIANAPATPATVTTGQAMQVWKATSLAVSANIQPQFAANTIVIPLA